MSSNLGDMLDHTRKHNIGRWKLGLLFFLGLILLANHYVHPHHAEYGYDGYIGFWAGFGLVVAVGMVILMKKIIQPILVRPEEHDDLDY
jgi:hypothetical protein